MEQFDSIHNNYTVVANEYYNTVKNKLTTILNKNKISHD